MVIAQLNEQTLFKIARANARRVKSLNNVQNIFDFIDGMKQVEAEPQSPSQS